MAQNYIKDNCNRIIGWASSVGGREYAYDKHGHILGSFLNTTNSSFDVCGRLLGSGNLMSYLVMKSSAAGDSSRR